MKNSYLDQYTVEIYDGYGQQITQFTHQDRGWDGRGYSPGTFAVVVKAHGIDGKWYETKQTVSLLQ